MLRATTASPFSTSQLPKVVRTLCVLYILTWKCASGHNGLQFFISHLASWVRTRRFSQPTFRPTGATNHWKNIVFRDFPTFFAHLHLLSSDLVSSDSSHLCFSTVHIVGSLTSKLPSNMYLTNFVYIYIYIHTWKSQGCKKMYSADLNSKNVFVEAKTYLFVFLWVRLAIFSDSFGS